MIDAQKNHRRRRASEPFLRRRRPLFRNHRPLSPPPPSSLAPHPLSHQVIAFDKLDYCASLHNLDEIKDKPNFKVRVWRERERDGKRERERDKRKKNRRAEEREEAVFFFKAIAESVPRSALAPALSLFFVVPVLEDGVSLGLARKAEEKEPRKDWKRGRIFLVLFFFVFFFALSPPLSLERRARSSSLDSSPLP